jgi:hydrogenase/urease accessory protein HupE
MEDGMAEQETITDSVAEAIGLGLLNAVNAQQQASLTANAAVADTVTRILADHAQGAEIPKVPIPPFNPGTYANVGEGWFALVGQAAAMAIQDATSYLRNVETIAAVAMGVALAGGEQDPSKALAAARSAVAAALKNLEDVSTAAAKVLKEFPRATP